MMAEWMCNTCTKTKTKTCREKMWCLSLDINESIRLISIISKFNSTTRTHTLDIRFMSINILDACKIIRCTRHWHRNFHQNKKKWNEKKHWRRNIVVECISGDIYVSSKRNTIINTFIKWVKQAWEIYSCLYKCFGNVKWL